MVALQTSTPLKAEGFSRCDMFAVAAAEAVTLALGYGSSFQSLPRPVGIGPQATSPKATTRGQSISLITLKAPIYWPSGGNAAAPTTSLPEKLGESAKVQIIYGLAGERRVDEYEIPWLVGYEGAKPVRFGNAEQTHWWQVMPWNLPQTNDYASDHHVSQISRPAKRNKGKGWQVFQSTSA
jgi:hypothetical protein